MHEPARSLSVTAATPGPIDGRIVLRQACDGDRDAFERLAVEAMPMLIGTARRLLRDRFAAEEAVADALFRAFRNVGSFRGESAFGTWLHRILCRVVADRYRSGAREIARQGVLRERARQQAPRAAAPDAHLVYEEESRRLRRAVEGLPARQRLVLLLHAWEGLTLAEIAEVLAMRYATVKSNLHHARRTLRSILAAAEEPDRCSRGDPAAPEDQ